MFTRDEFNLTKSKYSKAVKKHSIILAVGSVMSGLFSLQLLKWCDDKFTPNIRILISLITFFIFLTIVFLLYLKLKKITNETAPKCSECSKPMIGEALRISSATGKCENCGGSVIG